MSSTEQSETHVSLFEFELTGKLIGSGSYADVTLCKRYRGGQEYALKSINKQKAMQKRMVKYIQNERSVLLSLSHPHIVKLHFTSRDAENVYMFYEYCSKGELWAWLQRFPRKIVPSPLRRIWMAQIVSALEYIHAKGIAHRDLKPENIFVSADYSLKVGDFGTSKRMDDLQREDNEKEARLRAAMAKHANMKDETGEGGAAFEEHRRKSILYDASRSNSFTGTPEYMAPETVRSRNTRGTAVDLWSLGVLAYQLAAGCLPFTGESAYLVFLAMEKGELDWDRVDPETADLARQLLRVDPTTRLGVVGDDGDRDATQRLQEQSRASRVPVDAGEEDAEEDEEDGAVASHLLAENDEDTEEEGEYCPIRQRKIGKPLHLAHVDSNPAGWAAIKAHPYFQGIDWTQLRVPEDVCAVLDRLSAVRVQDGRVNAADIDIEEVAREFGALEVEDEVPPA